MLRNQPFIAPSFSPEIKYFCIAKKNIIIGIVEIIEPAAMNRQFEENIPCKLLTPTGRVYIASLVKTMLGQRNSPHEPIKVKMAKTASEGFTIGKSIFQKT
jgi:hypothetical protein